MIKPIPYHINKPGEGWKGLNREMSKEQFLNKLRENFKEALKLKTGWGRVELEVVFEQVLVKTLLAEAENQDNNGT